MRNRAFRPLLLEAYTGRRRATTLAARRSQDRTERRRRLSGRQTRSNLLTKHPHPGPQKSDMDALTGWQHGVILVVVTLAPRLIGAVSDPTRNGSGAGVCSLKTEQCSSA